MQKLIQIGLAFLLLAGTPVLGASGNAFRADRALAKKYEKYDQAVALNDKGEYAKAVPLLEQQLSEMPGDADVLNQLGYAKRHLGAHDESMVYYQKAVTANPDHKGVREYLGELYLILGKPADAKAQLVELERICALGCEEKRELREKIAAYETQQGIKTP